MKLNFHPAANEFPLLDKKRLQELADDIKQNGQRESIKLHNNLILDGRNRYSACQLIDVSPKTEALPNDIDPYLYVWSLNGERRDITAAQRYGIWKNCMEKSEAWKEKQRQIQEEANQKRAEAAKQQENRANQYNKPEKPIIEKKEDAQETAQPVRQPTKKHSDIGREAKAEASKTNRGTVERMDRLYRKRKDLYDKVVSGELTESAAIREMNRDENKTKLEQIAAQEPEKLNYKYDAIIMNPPFTRQQGIDHVSHALDCLKYDGRLVAIMSPGVKFRQNKKTLNFLDKLNNFNYDITDLPKGAFKESGTMVNAVILEAERRVA